MKIAALVTEAFGGHGGIALYNRDLITALAERDDVERIDVLPRLVRDTNTVDEQISAAIVNFDVSGSEGVFGYVKAMGRMLTAKARYDVIVCGHINLLPAAELVRRRHKAKLILFIYGIDAWQPTPRRLTNHLTGNVDAVVSISDFTRQRFLGWCEVPREKTHVLPNALHSERFEIKDKPKYLIERYGLANCRVMLTLGRLNSAERYKGVDELIDLMPRLLSRVSNIRYLVVGHGDDSERLKRRAEDAGVASQVIFTGEIAEKEKTDHYKLADAFVMVGRGEGFGFVYLEAMSCGIPVVASTRDGSREAVRNGEIGLLADPYDPDEVEEKVIAALEKPRRVPDGLDYFFYPRFCERLDRILGLTLNGVSAAK